MKKKQIVPTNDEIVRAKLTYFLLQKNLFNTFVARLNEEKGSPIWTMDNYLALKGDDSSYVAGSTFYSYVIAGAFTWVKTLEGYQFWHDLQAEFTSTYISIPLTYKELTTDKIESSELTDEQFEFGMIFKSFLYGNKIFDEFNRELVEYKRYKDINGLIKDAFGVDFSADVMFDMPFDWSDSRRGYAYWQKKADQWVSAYSKYLKRKEKKTVTIDKPIVITKAIELIPIKL